ncbi:MAG: C45 family peptidase [Myxococcota bacterium]
MRQAHPLAVVRLAGDEPSMGAQHGEITRALGGYDAALAFYPELPERILGGGRRGPGRRFLLEVMRPLLAAGLARLERARPDLARARTRAFLAALGRHARHGDARHMMVLDLIQNAIGVLGRLGVAPDHDVRRLAASFPGACTSFAAWGEASHDGSLVCGRNFDLPGIGVWERQPEVAFCAPTRGVRYGFVTTRGADVPGVTAFNEAGLVIAPHTRFHRAVSFDGRGVTDLVHLIARRATTITEAIAVASEQRIASSWGLFVSSARERNAVALEVHAGRVAVVPPAPGRAWHTCANRYRTPLMQAGELAPSEAWVRYSDGRQHAMERALGRVGPITPGQAMALMGSREAGDVDGWQRATGDTICQSITLQSVVFEPEHGRLWVGCGDAPASLGPWVEVPWRWGAPGVSVIAPTPGAVGADAGWPGYVDFMEAARLEGMRAPIEDVERALARALAAVPDDPSYLHLAGGCALRAGRPDEAVDRFERAQVGERSAFRRRELAAWTARARASRRRARAGLDVTVDFQLLTLS